MLVHSRAKRSIAFSIINL